jgi:voltage-gated potassium channel
MSSAQTVRSGRSVREAFREAFLDEHSVAFRRVQGVVMACIFASVASIILESVPWIAEPHPALFDVIEGIVVTIFTVEYAINIWVATDKRKYLLGPWGIIDLLAILPSIFLMLNITSIKVVRVLRVMRVLRILRVLKLARAATTRFHQREEKGLRMDLQIYFIALFCAVTLWSTLVYFAEHEQANTLFTSIPQSMWWGIVTLTTTGYGDMFPVTLWGRIFAAGTMITGLALFGLLMSVVGDALHVGLFGSRQQPAGAAVGAGTPAATPVLTAGMQCVCGEPLLPAWRVCPICETPTAGPTGP